MTFGDPQASSPLQINIVMAVKFFTSHWRKMQTLLLDIGALQFLVYPSPAYNKDIQFQFLNIIGLNDPGNGGNFLYIITEQMKKNI